MLWNYINSLKNHCTLETGSIANILLYDRFKYTKRNKLPECHQFLPDPMDPPKWYCWGKIKNNVLNNVNVQRINVNFLEQNEISLNTTTIGQKLEKITIFILFKRKVGERENKAIQNVTENDI